MDTCPNCGGTIVGDGYTLPRHCENIEPMDLEADAPVLYCASTGDNDAHNPKR